MSSSTVAGLRRSWPLPIDDGPSTYTPESITFAELVLRGPLPSSWLKHPWPREVLDKLLENGREFGNHAMHDELSISLSPLGVEGKNPVW